MDITAQLIEGLAPNASAAKNGRELVAKNKFSNLSMDEEKTLIWGECAGSGKTPYSCSADFIQPAHPVFRCSCPSRQFPCKHCLGLLSAYEKGLPFTTTPIPESIASKREKLEKRQEKKSEEQQSLKGKAAKPKAVNKAAVVKKTEAQLAGLEAAGKILDHIVSIGLSSLDAKETANIKAQVKELGNAYIPGVQTAFNNLLLGLGEVKTERYTPVINHINYLAALLKKGREYLSSRREQPELPPETDSEIEEQLGYVWKLTDLVSLGLCEDSAELVQLSFNVYDNPARREFVDEGAWLNLKNGKIYKTRQYRPYKAAKYINEEDSFLDVAQLRELYVYPGGLNPRVRWEPYALGSRPFTEHDLDAIHAFAAPDYAACVKTVKNIIKNPLADKHPLLLLALHKAWRNGGRLVIQDASGFTITLRDMPGLPGASGIRIEAEATLGTLLPADCSGMSLLVAIHNDVGEGLFTAQPLSLITRQTIIKLFY